LLRGVVKRFAWTKAGVCNHAALPGHMHIAKLVHGPELHVSRPVGKTTRWPYPGRLTNPFKTVVLTSKSKPFR